MLGVLEKGFKKEMRDGYKVITTNEGSEKFLVLKGENTTIVPMKKDIHKIYLEVLMTVISIVLLVFGIPGKMKWAIKCHSFGNIQKEGLVNIWQSLQYINFRYRVKEKKIPSCTDCHWLDGCSYTQDNEADCWGNEPSCADCLWYREIIICP